MVARVVTVAFDGVEARRGDGIGRAQAGGQTFMNYSA